MKQASMAMPHNARLTSSTIMVCIAPVFFLSWFNLGGSCGGVAWLSTTNTEGGPTFGVFGLSNSMAVWHCLPQVQTVVSKGLQKVKDVKSWEVSCKAAKWVGSLLVGSSGDGSQVVIQRLDSLWSDVTPQSWLKVLTSTGLSKLNC